MRSSAFAVALSLASPLGASDFRLIQPIDCTLGETCHIQQFMDRDPGPGVRDFRCFGLSYDGHQGTDFALPTLADMARGVDVLAAAPGRVRGVRDGMVDQIMTAENADAIAGRDCGNGVAITHTGGYETQYCHLKSGSITVREGQNVEAGSVLGQVGLSGRTEFPHLHLSVRRDGAHVDPFDPEMTAACDDGTPGLWSVPAPAYRPGGFLDAGFAEAIPGYAAVQAGKAAQNTLGADAEAIVVFGFLFGLREGDELAFRVTGPEGEVLARQVTIEKDQAQAFRAVGNRLRGRTLPSGSYTGRIDLRRGADVIDTISITIPVR